MLPETIHKYVGKVARRCNHCGGHHAGGWRMCKLVSIYSPAGQPPRWARAEAADMIEDYEDARADR